MHLENKDIRLTSAVLEVELRQTSASSVPTCSNPGRLATAGPTTGNHQHGQVDPCVPYAGQAAEKSRRVPEHAELSSFLIEER